ncbi:MAG: sulfatase-like hydrolase/transferase [bacterium]|nr:sulfatase-like hydrolase/transferase [bacterium]
MSAKKILLYSFTVSVFLSFNFIKRLTANLDYFKDWGIYDIAVDVLFLFFVWVVVFLVCFGLSRLIKNNSLRRAVFVSIATIAFIFVLINIKDEFLAFLYKYTQTDFYRNLKSFYFSLFPQPEEQNGKMFFKYGLFSVTGVFFVIFVYKLSFKMTMYAKLFFNIGVIMALLIFSNVLRHYNVRFKHNFINESLLYKKVEPLIKQNNSVPLPASVHIIFFDGMPYDLDFFEKSENFSKLISQSYFFRNAKAAGTNTFTAVPRMLTGKTSQVIASGKNLLVGKDNQSLVSVADSSIFSVAKKNGDAVYISGLFHEYCYLFRESTSECDDYPVYSTYTSFSNRDFFGQLALRWRTLKTGWLTLFNKNSDENLVKVPVIYGGKEEHNPYLWAALFKNLINDYQVSMEENKNPALFFTHLNLPHPPLVFNAVGAPLFKTKDYSSMPQATNDKYKAEMKYLDDVFGVLLKDIASSSDYDSSLIIVIADHGFKGLPEFLADAGRVPLIIKVPFQKERVDIQKEFDMASLYKVIENYYKWRLDKNKFPKFSPVDL